MFLGIRRKPGEKMPRRLRILAVISKRCDGCKRLQQVSVKEWKLVSCSSAFICSPDCLLKWLGANKCDDIGWTTKAIRRGNERWPDFKSKYEVYFAEWLDRHKLVWAYELWTFYVGDGTYTPDFFLPKYNVFIELKGGWGCGAKVKLKRFRKQWKDVSLIVVSWLCAEEIYDGACGLRLE